MEKKQPIEIKVDTLLLEKYGLPVYKTPGSAGMDLVSCTNECFVIKPGQTAVLHTGLYISINNPELVALVCGRSGLYFNHNIRVGNGIGVIDSDYHGEIMVMLHNDDVSEYIVEPGERIAQLLFMPVVQVQMTVVAVFSVTTKRSEGGFGHTGRI